MFSFHISLLKTLISILPFLLRTAPVFSWTASDRQILLRFKDSVTDPSAILSSWNPSSHHCSWYGVSCDSASRVYSIRIPGGNCRTGSPPAHPVPRFCDSTRGRLTGTLTASISGLEQIRVLSIPFHELEGEIPAGIWLLENLKVLDLEGNSFSGRLPHQLIRLQVVNLGFNPIEGSISEVLSSDFSLLGFLRLPCNRVTGPLPSSIDFCRSLKLLDLSANSISDSIPSALGRRKLVQVIGDNELWSNHDLSGSNPSPFLESLESLPPPAGGDEAVGAGTVSASPPGGKPGGMSSIEVASLISGSAIGAVLVALLLLFFCVRKWVHGSRVQVMELKEITVFSDPGVRLTFDGVVQATGNFSAGKCIGSGGFGATYKAEVSPGLLVAVKRVSVGRFVQGVQQFHAEIKTLGRIRHPNLVTLIGYHASQAEMFLVYNYLPGGNLERFIQERPEGAVRWGVVHRVASQIAGALAYLHDDCVPRVLHRDVKPSNILLDGRLNAYLSDFGLSRLMGASETHATTGVAGTFGYVAPEYAMTCRVSEKSDVYSYGVVLLELISDKKALDPSFSAHGNGFNIVSWACLLLRQDRPREVFTPRLWDRGPHDQLVSLLHLAVMCTVDSLSIRPTMRQVLHRLRQLHSPPPGG